MMVAAFFLGLAAVVGVYWLIGRDMDRVAKRKERQRD